MSPATAAKPLVVTARHPSIGVLFAAVDPSARFTEARVAQCRLGAVLAPYPSEADAREALIAVGGEVLP